MWMLTSSVLLATLLVSGLSFPHPDKKEYNIPEVGTGRRAQYYVSHRDGTFKYGHDTGDGAYEKAKSQSVGSKQGSFGYTDPDGRQVKLEYESGRGGFIARGDHLPKPVSAITDDVVQVTKRARPFIDPLADSDSDASYKFGFNSESHSRNEQSDSDGQISGSYNYVDDNGRLREYNYQAGKGIGFQITGEGLATPNQPTRRSGSSFRTGTAAQRKSNYRGSSFSDTRKAQHSSGLTATRRHSVPQHHRDALIKTTSGDNGEYSFSYSAGTHSRSETGDKDQNVEGIFEFTVPEDDNRRKLEYEAGSDTGFIVTSDHLPVGPSVPGAEDGKPSGQFVKSRNQRTFVDPLAGSDADASYKFGFESDAYSRSESADEDGNVVGTYTLVEEDGTRVKNKFRAGKGIGFEISEVSRVPGSPINFRSTNQHTKPVATGITKISPQTQPINVVDKTSFRTSFNPINTFEEADIRTSYGDGGAYSFSYNTDTHGRAESGDENNDVVGEFHFLADDGVRRKLEYEAGRNTGFIARADHLPVGPSVPGAEDGKPSGQFARHQNKKFVDPLASNDGDSSYNFEFESDTYSRSETADKDGNIVGSFTVVEEDGTRVKTKFRAGKGIGYEIQDISRVAGVPPQRSTFRSSQTTSPFTPQKQPVQNKQRVTDQRTSVRPLPSFVPIPTLKTNFQPSNIVSTTGENGEYSFSYNTDSHSRAETGDSDNNVIGDFSFIADDGIRRELQYEAGRETGFIVEADHLPVGPSVPGAEDGRPSGQFARRQKSRHVSPSTKIRVTPYSSRGTLSHSQKTQGGLHTSSLSTRKSSISTGSGRRQSFSDSQRKSQQSTSSRRDGSNVMVKPGKMPGSTVITSPEYSIYRYEPSPQAEKYGYVIQYN